MKKLLSRIFSVVLITATVASPSMAQLAKKAVNRNSAKTTVTMKAQTAPQKSAKKGKSLLDLHKTRTAGVKGIKTAKKASNIVRPSQTVMKADAQYPTINGSMIYSATWEESGADYGVYTLPTGAGQSVEKVVTIDGSANYGGVLVDGVYYYNYYYNLMGILQLFTTYGVDIESGETVYEAEVDPSVFAPGGMALDPTTGNIFGIFYNEDASAMELATISYSGATPAKTTIAALSDADWCAFAIDGTGQFYGIRSVADGTETGKLYKIDRQTGATTLVGDTGFAPYYQTGATIDSKTNRMFWTVSPADESGNLVEVNLSTGVGTLIKTFENGEEISGLYVPAPEAEPTAPAACKNVNVHFDGSSLEGTVTLTTPATLFDGTTQGSGELFVMVLANGEIVAGGEPQPWNTQITIPVDLSLMGPGKYDFVVFASGDGGDGPKTKVKNVWVGPDTPEATKATLAYNNGNMELKWNAVTASVNGGYIDLDNLTYKVVRADGSVAAEGLKTTTFTEAVAEPESITSYYYEVYAVDGTMVSAPARSNVVTLGSIVPPYTADFGANGLSGWTVIDGNDDGKVWTVQNDGSIRVSYNSKLDMDDWLITPQIKLEAGKAYNVSFMAKTYSERYGERFEVKFGKSNTADGMTNTLIAPTDIATGEYQSYESMLVPDADGSYYIGFHGISDPDKFYLYIKDIKIEAGVSAAAPGLVTDLKAVPDATGALKCNVSFKAPSTTMAGQTLTSLTKVEVYRGEEVVKTFTNPSVGEALSFDDTLAEGGNVTYTVVGSNVEGAGLKAKVSTYVGFAEPAAMESASIARTANEGEVVVTWDAVTKDVNGLVYPEGAVTYAVCKYENNAWTPFVTNLTGTSYSYQAVPAGEQDFVDVAVFPFYKGESGMGAATDMIAVGTPYAGIQESFSGKTLKYIWGLKAIGGGSVGLYDDESGIPAQDGDGGFIGIKGQNLDTGADFFSGLVSLNQMVNPGLTFYTYNIIGEDGTPDINEISVSIRTVDGANESEYVEVFKKSVVEIVGEGVEGWGKVTVNLADYANKVIQFRITGVTKQYVYTFIDNIKVGSLLDNDLKAVSISAPANVKCGENYNVDVTVANEGTKNADAYSVELYKDGDLAATKELTNLASGARKVVTFEETMSGIAEEPVSYYAKVVYASDEDENNNQTSTVTVTPKVSNLPKAVDLKGESADNGVKLSWNEPELDGVSSEVTEDFEDADAFSAEYGDWKFVDVDDSPVGGFQDMDLPGITPGTTKGSFWIWDQTNGIGNQTFDAHSGMKYLFSLFRYDDGAADDWAISPELNGQAQTISFFAKSYSANYPEKIEVYYSNGSLLTTDFVKVDGVGGTVPGEWTEYTAAIPAGAKYFAIRSCATSSFMLMVDDVTYTPASQGQSLQIKGYNVYRDGVKINDAPVQETEYLDTQVQNGKEYTYVVTVVYEGKGESAASNEVVVNFTGSGVGSVGDGVVSISVAGSDIIVLNAAGLNVNVVTADGAVVFNGVGEDKTVVNVASGVYVVKAGKTVKKLMVK